MNNLSNTSIPASGGKGTGSTCAGNCTTGTPPPVVCTTNPNDPSCPPIQQPLTPPTTQTCPDGSQPDSSGKCPTAQFPPPPQSSNQPSGSGNNNSPSGSGGSGGGGGSSGSGSGSSPPSPSTQS